jgi:hypothetical protein
VQQWLHAVELRTEWRQHALSTAPADRATAEAAITGLYGLLKRPPPEFVWVDSPGAVASVLPPTTYTLASGGPWPLESRLATQLSALRERLDDRLGQPYGLHWGPGPPRDPLVALRSGRKLSSFVDDGVRGALCRTVRESVADLMRAQLADRYGLYWYGQQEADWVAHYEVRQRVLGVRFGAEDTAALALWAAIARSCGWWWPRENHCVIAERPLAIHAEPLAGNEYGEARLHNADGPAVLFPDGWAVYAWHGTWVPSWVVEAPTVELIEQERNIEIRRCAIEHLGWPAFVDEAGLVLLAQAPDPGNPDAELRLYDLPYRSWGARTRLLLAVNGSVERDGTRRQYGLRVPPWFDDPIDAAGWSYGLTGAQYRRLLRRT